MDGGTLVEYKFDKIGAMRHIEAVNGKREMYDPNSNCVEIDSIKEEVV